MSRGAFGVVEGVLFCFELGCFPPPRKFMRTWMVSSLRSPRELSDLVESVKGFDACIRRKRCWGMWVKFAICALSSCSVVWCSDVRST